MTKTKTQPHPFARLSPEDKDSLILSAIIGQAALKPKREVKPYNTHDGVCRGNPFAHAWGHVTPDGPCCAIGAGILFHNLGPLAESAIEAFAEKYGVSLAYASGVSSGFENALDTDLAFGRSGGVDLYRGFQVGKAAFEALHGGGV